MRAVLAALFKSDFFKGAINKKKVKSPAELVAGVLKQTGEFRYPKPGMHNFAGASTVMGQNLLNPPTVEGWHTGHEWIDSGTLSERVNFAEKQFGDPEKPGIKEILDRAGGLGGSPETLVDTCLDLMGGVRVSEATRRLLVEYAQELNTLEQGDGEEKRVDVLNLLQMIVSTVDYQFA